MSSITLYHNPGCSKSRGAKKILEGRGADFEVVEYLDAPLDASAIEGLLAKLPDPPAALVRQDAHFEALGLDAGDYTSAAAVAALLSEHPRLMQRPVGVRDGHAVIARPPELIETLI